MINRQRRAPFKAENSFAGPAFVGNMRNRSRQSNCKPEGARILPGTLLGMLATKPSHRCQAKTEQTREAGPESGHGFGLFRVKVI